MTWTGVTVPVYRALRPCVSPGLSETPVTRCPETSLSFIKYSVLWQGGLNVGTWGQVRGSGRPCHWLLDPGQTVALGETSDSLLVKWK